MIDKISFLTPSNQGIFFGNLFNILYMVMPLLLIWAAFEFGGQLLEVIRNAFSRIDRNENDDYKDDDYDD